MDWTKNKECYESFLILEKSLSKNSVKAYMNDINKLIAFLGEKATDTIVPPEGVKVGHLKGFTKWLSEHGVSPRSQARTISGVKSFYKYLLIEGIVDSDPTSLLEAPPVGRKLPEVLSKDEIERLLNAVDLTKSEGQRNKAIVEVLYSCGLRVSELIDLKLTSLHFKRGFVKILGKADKERIVPISKKAVKEVNRYMRQERGKLDIDDGCEDILFLSRRGQKLSRVMILTIIKNLAVRANLRKNVSPHTFRHSFASQLIEGGADLRVVQKMLGHESILTTEIYTHLNKDYLKDTVNRHHPRS